MAKLCKTLPLLHWFHGSTTENSAACSLPGLPPWPSYVDELSWHTLPWPHPLVLFHVAPCFSHKDLTKKSAFVTFVHWFQHISNHWLISISYPPFWWPSCPISSNGYMGVSENGVYPHGQMMLNNHPKLVVFLKIFRQSHILSWWTEQYAPGNLT